MFSRLPLILVLALANIGFAGCGGGGGDDPSDSSLLGIYAVDTRTENAAGCEAEGDSVLDDRGEDAFYIKAQDFFGIEYLEADFCVDVSDCVGKVADESITLGALGFDAGNDDDGWTGSGHLIGGGGEGPCSGQVFEYSMTSVGTDRIRIEERRTNVDNVPRDSDDFCDGEAAEAMAASLPCSELAVTTAAFVQQ